MVCSFVRGGLARELLQLRLEFPEPDWTSPSELLLTLFPFPQSQPPTPSKCVPILCLLNTHFPNGTACCPLPVIVVIYYFRVARAQLQSGSPLVNHRPAPQHYGIYSTSDSSSMVQSKLLWSAPSWCLDHSSWSELREAVPFPFPSLHFFGHEPCKLETSHRLNSVM